MKTRSQTRNLIKLPLLEVNIDFDYASKCWRENKIELGGGVYRYVCCNNKNNKQCNSKCLPGELYCKTHIKIYKKCMLS